MKRGLLVMTLVALAPWPVRAFDGDKLARHLRETLGLDTRTAITVQGEPRRSNFAGLNKVTLLVGGAPYDVYLTTDGGRYFWGLVNDLSVSPDAKRVAAIDLRGAHAVGASTAPVTIVEYSDMA